MDPHAEVLILLFLQANAPLSWLASLDKLVLLVTVPDKRVDDDVWGMQQFRWDLLGFGRLLVPANSRQRCRPRYRFPCLRS